MDDIKTINIIGLVYGEREKLIFPNIEALKEQEQLKIIVEFNQRIPRSLLRGQIPC